MSGDLIDIVSQILDVMVEQDQTCLTLWWKKQSHTQTVPVKSSPSPLIYADMPAPAMTSL